MRLNNTTAFFIIGLLAFYLTQVFAPNKAVYYSSYFVAAYLFYHAFKNIETALTLTLIMSLFSEISIAASLFSMQPEAYRLGSGFVILPMTVIAVALTLYTINKKINVIYNTDIFLFAMFCWAALSTLFNLDQKSLFGFLRFSQAALVYTLFRVHINRSITNILPVLLTSMLIFQCSIAIFQVYQGKPLGIVAEAANTLYPSGYFTTEEVLGMFRASGTFGHPNVTASVFIALSPFVYAFMHHAKSRYFSFIVLYATYLAIFFTYSRVATVVFVLLHIFTARRNQILTWMQGFHGRYMRIILLIALAALLLLTIPTTLTRILSLPRSFEESGSLGFRIKLAREAAAIMNNFPLFGVGLERSLPHIIEEPVTDVFQVIAPSNFYRIHSIFLELGSEIGIPGLILFIAAIVTTFLHKCHNTSANLSLLSKVSLLGVIVISAINPFLHTSQFVILGFFIALILAL